MIPEKKFATADVLAQFRKELVGHGFSPDVIDHLVIKAGEAMVYNETVIHNPEVAA